MERASLRDLPDWDGVDCAASARGRRVCWALIEPEPEETSEFESEDRVCRDARDSSDRSRKSDEAVLEAVQRVVTEHR